MWRTLASRLVRSALALAAALVIALLVLQSGFTESRKVGLNWPHERGADPLHVAIFAVWRGSATDSPPQRIKVMSSGPGAATVWTYVDPAALQCYDTSGDGASKGAPLGELSGALLRERLPALPDALDASELEAGLSEVEAHIHRIAADGLAGMTTRPDPARSREAGFPKPTIEFPHWQTFAGPPAARRYAEPAPFYAAVALAGAGVLAAGVLLVWPCRARAPAAPDPFA